MQGTGDEGGTDALPREELVAMRAEALSRLLRDLPGRSPFYRRKLAGSTVTPARLQDLPTTPRPEVMDAQDGDPPWGGLLAVPLSSISIIGFTNAISAGLPGSASLQVAATATDMGTRVDTASRALSMAGALPGGTTAIVGEVARSLLHHVLLGAMARLGATPFQTGRGLTLRHVRHTLPELAPAQLVTHPTYALHLARVLEEEGTSLPVQRLFLWGEVGPSVPNVRKVIEEAWDGARVRNVYAMEETGVLAAECAEEDGLHCFEDRFVYEVLDPASGEALGPGQRGELAVTTLVDEAMPLLRYRTGDLVMMDDGPCPCGGTHARIHVLGRVAEAPSGPRVIDLAKVERLLGRFPQLLGVYRVVLEGDEGFLEVPMAALDGDQQAVAINTALLAARSTGIDLRPVKDLPRFPHRAVRVVRAEELDWWEALAEEQGRLET